MSKFFDSELIHEELEEINDLQKFIYGSILSFGSMTREDKLEHIEKMTFDFETFLQLQMSLPSIEEQTAIAQVLQTADKELQLLKSKLAHLKEQKKGLMQVLLTGKKRLKINNI